MIAKIETGSSRINPSTRARVSRRRNEPDSSTYAGLLAARLRALRDAQGWSITDLQDRLRAAGHVIPVSTLYAYERGKSGGGADLPVDMIPVLARIYGFSSPRTLLDQNYPASD